MIKLGNWETRVSSVLETVSLKDIPKILHLLPEAEQAKLLEELERLEELKGK